MIPPDPISTQISRSPSPIPEPFWPAPWYASQSYSASARTPRSEAPRFVLKLFRQRKRPKYPYRALRHRRQLRLRAGHLITPEHVVAVTQQTFGGIPAHALVRHRNPENEIGRILRHGLITFEKIALQHRPDNGTVASCPLLDQRTPDLLLPSMLFG